MRRPMWTLVLGASATMLAAGWRAGTAPSPGLTLAEGGSDTGSVATPAATPAASPAATGTVAPPPPPPPPAGPTGTFVGPSVGTSYGSFQVQIVVNDGTITDVQPLVIGLGDRTSRDINANAVPTLEARVLDAQSANVSYVSGASYTSQGYLGSVSGAMSTAGI